MITLWAQARSVTEEGTISVKPNSSLSLLDGRIHDPTGMGLFSDFGRLSFMTTRSFAAGVVLSRS